MKLKKLPKNKTGFVFIRDMEAVEIYLNGKEIASLNHDNDGWMGMTNACDMVKKIGKILKIDVTETNSDELTDLVERLKKVGGL